ncbi:hypothetical protein F7R12_22315 [Pseudomonas tolaasii]|nr:hypothetical protein F7R12_22315 [Pseudomonas tolaasii]
MNDIRLPQMVCGSQPCCVGAGLPAMQAPRGISHTAVILSQASQLPQLISVSHWNQRDFKPIVPAAWSYSTALSKYVSNPALMP